MVTPTKQSDQEVFSASDAAELGRMQGMGYENYDDATGGEFVDPAEQELIDTLDEFRR